MYDNNTLSRFRSGNAALGRHHLFELDTGGYGYITLMGAMVAGSFYACALRLSTTFHASFWNEHSHENTLERLSA